MAEHSGLLVVGLGEAGGDRGLMDAPWVNPPLRSLRWIEALLSGLAAEGFTDDQVLFTYRTFNSFLLGYLLLETSAMALRDPKPGDGSFTQTDTTTDEEGGRSPEAAPTDRSQVA
jgi:hypothetical protein